MKCITAKDLLCWLWINFWTDCDKQSCKLNAILRRHYTNLVNTKITRCAIGFTWGWHQQLTTADWSDIYRVLWVYVELEDNCDIWPCYRKEESCWCDCDDTYSLAISEAYWELWVWEYSVDWNEVCINVWENVKRWHIVYSRWPKEISSIEDDICLEPMEIEILQMWVLRYQAEIEKDFNLAKYFEQQMYNLKTRIVELEDRIPFSIKWYK